MEYRTNPQHTAYQEQPGLGDLFSTLSAQVTQLLRQEVQLAQAEMTQKANLIGRHAALVILGTVIAQAGFLALVAAMILVLSLFVELWISALLVGTVLIITAVLLAQYGVKKLKTIDLAPRQTVETIKENTEWLTQQV